MRSEIVAKQGKTVAKTNRQEKWGNVVVGGKVVKNEIETVHLGCELNIEG